MLDAILAHKQDEVAVREERTPISVIRARAEAARPVRSFAKALQQPGISLIAEVKRKSPSYGQFRPDFDPLGIARTYARNGARAISVLGDEEFFGGGPDIVQLVANAPEIDIPVMFKDFMLRPYQVYEARATGADAVLVIVRAVDQPTLRELIGLTHELGMDALVEVFLPAEAERALEAGARIVGINNRDLQTFQADTERSAHLRSLLPSGIVTVSESGLTSRSAVVQAERAGFDGMLVGEALMKAPDPGAMVREFLGQ